MVGTAEAKQVSRAASTLLFPGLEFGVKPCGKYTREDLPTFSVRLFYFLFAVALYNLWVLANVLVAGESRIEKPLISTRIFRQLVVPDYG